jgi:hypothetical protein
VLAGVRDQQGWGPVDVLGQHLDGPVRVAGESEFLELPVFGGKVALVVVGEALGRPDRTSTGSTMTS